MPPEIPGYPHPGTHNQEDHFIKGWMIPLSTNDYVGYWFEKAKGWTFGRINGTPSNVTTLGFCHGAILLDVSDSSSPAVYYNNGDKDTPDWVAFADAAGLGLSAVFTGTPATADTSTVKHDASAATNGTPLYVGIKRGETSPGMFVSECANAATAYFQTAGGLSVPVIYTPIEEADITVKDSDTASSLGGELRLRPVSGVNRWGSMECIFTGQMTNRFSTTFNTATPTDTVQIHEDPYTNHIWLPLESARELATNDIPNSANNGGLLAKDTTPILETDNAGTDNSTRINYATGVVDPISWNVTLPPNYDGTRDMVLVIRTAKGSDSDTVTLTAKTYWDGGAAVTDTSGTIVQNEQETLITIDAGDVSDAGVHVGVELYPSAHGNDALYIYSVALRYDEVSPDWPVYFDEDAANTDERFLHAGACACDCYVRLNSGRLWQIKYDASAATNGVKVYVDDDAGGGATERLVFTSPTDADGAATTGSADGLYAIDGLWTAAVTVVEANGNLLYETPLNVDVPIWTLSGNLEFLIQDTAQAEIAFCTSMTTAARRPSDFSGTSWARPTWTSAPRPPSAPSGWCRKEPSSSARTPHAAEAPHRHQVPFRGVGQIDCDTEPAPLHVFRQPERAARRQLQRSAQGREPTGVRADCLRGLLHPHPDAVVHHGRGQDLPQLLPRGFRRRESGERLDGHDGLAHGNRDGSSEHRRRAGIWIHGKRKQPGDRVPCGTREH